MVDVKEFYRNYVATWELVELHERLHDEILKLKPSTLFEYGCGSGKNLLRLKHLDPTIRQIEGVDISEQNVHNAKELLKDMNGIITLGDEELLNYYCDETFSVSFTCSVLDHIEDIDEIITQLKRISKIGIVIAETNNVVGDFYYPHNYEQYGFKKIDFQYTSLIDGAVYSIWKWLK